MPNRAQFEAINGDGSKLTIETIEGGLTQFTITTKTQGTVGLTVQSADVAGRMSMLPGYAVGYVPPIKIPSYLGAVVERTLGPANVTVERYVRVAHDSDSSLPWIASANGSKRSNDDIAAILANGGYERQPEFPHNG